MNPARAILRSTLQDVREVLADRDWPLAVVLIPARHPIASTEVDERRLGLLYDVLVDVVDTQQSVESALLEGSLVENDLHRGRGRPRATGPPDFLD